MVRFDLISRLIKTIQNIFQAAAEYIQPDPFTKLYDPAVLGRNAGDNNYPVDHA